VFKSVFRQLQRGKALEEMVFLDDHYLECVAKSQLNGMPEGQPDG
jgi:hypothetical protein